MAMGQAQSRLLSGPSQESFQPKRGLRHQGKSVAKPGGQAPGKAHRCAHCRRRFPGWVALWLHSRRCQARLPLPCHECNQRFRHAPFLALHLQVHASAIPDLGFTCHLCGHSFRGWVALVLHLRAHSAAKRPITCPECGRRFWRQKQLRAHLQRCHPPAPEARPFICGNCGRSFAQWDQLVVHKRVHVTEALEEAAAKALGPRPRGRPAVTAPRPGGDAVDRPFQCACCGKRFRHKPNLIAHRRVHTGERPHQCPECGKRFTNKPYLTSHRRIHTGEKPYPCTECGRRFRHKPNLLSHSKIHKRSEVSAQAALGTGSPQIATEPMAQPALGAPLGSPRTPAEASVPLHSCADCGRSFRLERFLRLHQRQHTGERPFACPECGKNFGKKTHLVAHSRVHSAEEEPMLERRCRGTMAMGQAQSRLLSGPSQESFQPKRGLRHQGKSVAKPGGQAPGKAHRCAHCRRRFPGWVALWLHSRRCQARLPLPCHECNQRFRHAPFLALHLQVHASAIPDLGFTCHLCGHSFRGWVALVLHLRAHSAAKRPITCPECGRRFWRQKQLRAHLQRCHPPAPEARPFICGNCGRSFAQWDQLVVHKRVHVTEALEEAAAKALGPRPRGRPAVTAPRPGGDAVDRPFQCACCGKRFRHKPNLIAHRRVHTGERPHQCPECGKRFTNKPYLTSHRRIHTGEKPYPCTECGRRFRHKPNLLSHSKIHKRSEVSAQAALGTGSPQIATEPMAQPALGAPLGSPRTPAEASVPLHSCADCGRSFRLERFLRLHQRQHTGERPFACPECGKNFGKKTHLVAHSRVHSGERPFACEDFSQKSNLITHRKSHIRDGAFCCAICGQTFDDEDRLLMHQKQHDA
ncbi:hypothetical protein A6R68_17205 [Neotoma lepida]|uniref:C2H2-type domain-containing protein n=1 Tax=Neotoma lepida TaxID=56216 RepID=A0A1A6HCP5_NEOLE|nr:hypothetical protein A6R68_17205 [Neotoma lepida]